MDIVRLTIVDFPAGTLSGEWQEVSCVAGGRYFDVADSSIFEESGNKERASSAIAGSGPTKSFTVALSATEDLSGTQTLSGGVGSVPFGVSNKYGFHPFLGTQGFAKPQLSCSTGRPARTCSTRRPSLPLERADGSSSEAQPFAPGFRSCPACSAQASTSYHRSSFVQPTTAKG